MATHYLACDLGADSGRLMLGTLDNGKIAVEELHRFPNGPVKTSGALHWNIDGLFDELKTGLKKAAARKLPIASISSDSWGVDYVLYDERGLVMPPVWCYRDSRTAYGVENVRAKVDWPAIYAETGIQFMALNTIYQLATEPPERLARAKQLLLIGDAFNFFCSGVARNEVSLASTTQLYNPQTKTWSKRLFDALKLREDLFAPICPSGTRLGPMKKNLATETGLPQIEVIASCSHDTGAAVAAVPASGANWAYLSSGTWSLMGVEWPQPVINDQARSLQFTNEIGYGGSVRLLKNIVGLWIVQECRRHWAKEGKKYDFAMLEKLAADAPPFVSLFNPDDPRFLSPDDMPRKDRRVLRGNRPARAREPRRLRALHLRKPRPVLPRRRAPAGAAHRQKNRAAAHRRRRQPGRHAEPMRRQRAENPRHRRPDRMHRAGQHPGAGHRARPSAVARRRARSRPQFLRAENRHAAGRRAMGRRRRAV